MYIFMQFIKSIFAKTFIFKWINVARIHNDFTNFSVPVYGITLYGGSEFGVVVGNSVLYGDDVVVGDDYDANMDISRIAIGGKKYVINNVTTLDESRRLVSLSFL